MSRSIVLPWLIWIATIVVVIGGAVWLASCATKPLPACPPILVTEVLSPQLGHGFFMDEEDADNLRAHIKGLRAGTCRSVLPGETES